MKVLGIDSSGLVASVAIVDDQITIAEYTVNYKKTHSQTLLPMLEEISEMIELDLNSIDAIAVASGPGSFTGLRIGSATAKGLGLALKKPLVAIPTLEAMAFQCYGMEGIICPILDARRGQVYTGIYQFVKKKVSLEEFQYEIEIIQNQTPMQIEELIDVLNKKEMKVIFLGDGIPVFEEEIRNSLHVPFNFAPSHLNRQRAASIATLAFRYLERNEMESAMEYKPNYLRMSQAERERLEKEK